MFSQAIITLEMIKKENTTLKILGKLVEKLRISKTNVTYGYPEILRVLPALENNFFGNILLQ